MQHAKAEIFGIQLVLLLPCMKISEAREHFIQSLKDIYDAREAGNIFGIIQDDVFNLALELSANDELQLNQMIGRLQRHEPIQYILGEADFYGLIFKVSPDVLIPRPETEELVNAVIKEVQGSRFKVQSDVSLKILDIGTGSGCISVTLKKNLPQVQVTSIDISEKALSIAKENALRNETTIDFMQLDFLNEDAWRQLGKYDIIVTNPPYITEAEFNALDKMVKDFEPQTALIAQHTDPFIFYHKIAAFAQTHLNSNGKIFLELNADHALEIEQIFSGMGYQTNIINDLQGKQRMLKAFVD